jgi:hypothetical protein
MGNPCSFVMQFVTCLLLLPVLRVFFFFRLFASVWVGAKVTDTVIVLLKIACQLIFAPTCALVVRVQVISFIDKALWHLEGEERICVPCCSVILLSGVSTALWVNESMWHYHCTWPFFKPSESGSLLYCSEDGFRQLFDSIHLLLAGEQGVMSQQMWIIVNTAVRTSNLPCSQ